MKWEYSKTWKALAIVVNQICAVVLVLSVVVCTVYVGSSGFGWVGKIRVLRAPLIIRMRCWNRFTAVSAQPAGKANLKRMASMMEASL